MNGLPRRPDRANSRELRLDVRRLANALFHGIDSSFHRGEGTDYVNSRPYVDGDAVGSVDWRATARTGCLFVREYRSPRGTPIYLVVDRTPSMYVGSGPKTKFDWAVDLAVQLAFAALSRMNPVGLVAMTNGIPFQPACNSRNRVLLWHEELRQAPRGDTCALADSLRFVETIRTRSLIVVLSDLLDPDAVTVLKRLPTVHEVVAIRLCDPAERSGPRSAFLLAQEPETGRTFIAAGRGGWREPARHDSELVAGGVELVAVDIGVPVVPRIAAFLRARRTRRSR